jgi:hypothetical protein
MRKRFLLLAFFALSSLNFALAQSVPFPPGTPPNDVISPWGYQQVGTTWDTSPFLPFIYRGVWFRMILPNGVTYNSATNTFNFTDPTKKYPLIIFNHGAGEAGTNNNHQLIHGGQIHRDAVRNNVFPGFAVYWQTTTGTLSAQWYVDLVNRLVRDLQVDQDRVYTHGLSRGGTMTWFAVDENPKVFAAAFPMSSGASNFDLDVVEIPMRLSQGGKDTNPTPGYTQSTVDRYNNAGGNLQYFYFPTLGHNTWNTCYQMSDFFSWFLSQKKYNIHVFFGNKEVCLGDPINIKLGLTGGFDGYEWSKDGATIGGATGHNYVATQYGVYRARFRRGAQWTPWSDPVEIKIKQPTQTPPIQTDGLQSSVLPSPDGSTSVTLALAPGFQTYAWKQVGSETIIGTNRTKLVGIGSYIGAVTEVGGCSSVYSQPYTVVDANGPNPPDQITNLRLAPIGKTAIQLNWDNNPAPAHNETGFEIYRSTSSSGPWELETITAADVLSYLDQNLVSGVKYYYIIRPVNGTGAGVTNAPVSITTGIDEISPTAPSNLTKGTVTSSSVALSWAASTDDVGVAGYDIFVNGFKTNTTTSLSAVVNGLTPGTLYNFIVKARDGAGNVSPASNQVTQAVVMSGLTYKYYQGDWNALPNFDALTPVASGVLTNFSLTPRLQNDYFGFVYTGKLNVTTAGNYTFYLSSDDGSKLYIDGVLRVSNDGLHGTGDVAGTAFALSAGVHDIRVDYFDKNGGEGLTVRWSRNPGLNIQNIPTSALTDAYTLPPAPPFPTNFAIAATSYQSINLTWSFSGTATSFEIQRSLNGSSWTNIAIIPSSQTSYLSTGLNPNTRYYYRMRSISSAGESTYTATRNVFTQVLPPIPIAPSNLASTNVTTKSVSLIWSDNSNNEEGFDVFRSPDNNTSYSAVATVPTPNYIDSSATLLPHSTYFYKVRSKNAGGASAYSNEIQATTQNSQPTLTSIVDTVELRYDEVKVVVLNAFDADADPVFIEGAVANPAFASLFDYGEGTAELFLEPVGAGSQGSYNLEFTAVDAFGGASQVLKLHVVVNNNHSPVIDPFDPLTIKETHRVVKTFTASDVDGGALTWSFNNVPSFVKTSIVANNLVFDIEPQETDAGVYQVDVAVADSQGSQDVKSFEITVQNFNANFTVSVSLGQTTVAPAPWNNFKTATPVAGTTISTLVNQNNQATSIGITLNSNWETSSAANGSTPGIYPNPVMLSNFSTTKANGPEYFTITGLVPNHKYNFDFFGSRALSGSNRVTIIEINGVTAQYEASLNTQNLAEFNSIVPNAAGEVQVKVTAGPSAQFGYLNSIVIESIYDGTTAPAAPSNLEAFFAETGEKDVILDWEDNSTTELHFEVYKSVEGGAFSRIATLPSNTSTYTDLTTDPFVTYSYTVRATNTNGNSPYSDTVSIVGANNSPVLAQIPVVSVGVGQTRTVQLVATDADGGPLSFSLDGAPAFASVMDVSNGSANLILTPTAGDVGNHFMNVMVFDDQGDLDYQEVVVVVSEFQETYVYLNFSGPGGGTAPLPWNNFNQNPSGNVTASNLKDNFNAATTISVGLSGFSSTTGGAVANGAGIYPDNVILTSFVHGNGTSGVTRTVTISGLKTDYLYDFDFLPSRAGNVGRTTTFSVGSQTQTISTTDNINRLAKLVGIKPDGTGRIIVNVTTGNGGYAYMNSMVLHEYSDLGRPNAPINLTTSVLSRTSARLNWVDLSDNEVGFEIYRSTSNNTNYVLVTTTAANTVTFTDNGLAQNTTYFYKIRSKKDASTFSTYSNEGRVTTYNSKVSINFAAITNATPNWNNFRITDFDVVGESKLNLIDDSGINSGIGIELVAPFNAEDASGVNTGNNSGIVPDAVLSSFFNVNPDQVSSMKLKNLSFLQQYTIGFISSKAAGRGDRTTRYQIGSKSAIFDCLNNSQTIIYLTDIVPDANGEITFEISAFPGAIFGYINGITILASTNPNPPSGGRMAAKSSIREEGSIEVYPNPFTDFITVNTSEEVVSASLTATSGKSIAVNGESDGQSYKIDLRNRDLTSGLYLMQVTFKSGNKKTVKVLRK